MSANPSDLFAFLDRLGIAHVTSIGREDLVRFLEATGHPPRVVAVAEQAAPPAR
jgi:hypothetical protein